MDFIRATLDFNELKAKVQFLINLLVKHISKSSLEFCLDNLHVLLSSYFNDLGLLFRF